MYVKLKALLNNQWGRLQNLTVLLLANVFTAGVGFLTTVTIANTLGSARFGQVAYAMAIGGIIAANVRFGMDRSLIRDLTHFPERFNETLAASLLARISLLVLCITGVFILKALSIENFEISWGMILIILATVLDPLRITNVFDVWEVQGRDALLLCVQKGLYFLLIWGVVLYAPENLGLNWIGTSMLFAVLLMLVLQYRYAWGKLKPSFLPISVRKLLSTALKLIKSNRWLWLASLAALGMTALNNVVLKHFAGFADLGVYAALFQLVSLGALLLKDISRIGRPVLARYTIPGKCKAQATVRFLALYMAFGFVAVSCIALPAVLFPKFIIETFFNAEYARGVWVLRIFGLYLIFRVFDTILGQYIVLMRADRLFLVTLVASGLITLGTCLGLAPVYGATGAAMALLTGELVLAASYMGMTFFQLKKTFEFS